LGAANLDTQLADLPTNLELATALGTADDAVLAAIAAEAVKTSAIQAVTVKIDTGLVLDGAVYQWTANALELAPTGGGGGGGLDAAGVRAAIGLATANLDTQLDALCAEPSLRANLSRAEAVDLLLAGVVGKSSTPSSTTEQFRFLDDDPAFTTTFDTNNNRTGVSLS
jgi:hypothetical protein